MIKKTSILFGLSSLFMISSYLLLKSTVLISRYSILLLDTFLIFIILSISFDLLYGYIKYINLSHSAFFGLGSYISAILYSSGVSIIICVLLSMLSGFILSSIISKPLFRLKGAYFTVITLALSLFLGGLATNLESLTGGYQGILLKDVISLDVTPIIILVACASFSVYHVLNKSSFGLTAKSIGSDEIGAESLGVNTLKHKIFLFILSSVFATLAGSLFPFYNGYVNPAGSFGLLIIFLPLVMTVLGGSGIVFGPVIGSIIIVTLIEILSINFPTLLTMILGLILISCGLFFKNGLLRYFLNLIGYLRKK